MNKFEELVKKQCSNKAIQIREVEVMHLESDGEWENLAAVLKFAILARSNGGDKGGVETTREQHSIRDLISHFSEQIYSLIWVDNGVESKSRNIRNGWAPRPSCDGRRLVQRQREFGENRGRLRGNYKRELKEENGKTMKTIKWIKMRRK